MSMPDPGSMWETRDGGVDGFLYGTEPNDFLAKTARSLTIGDVLCVADGEGRNGVFMAELGHRVTSVDLTQSGMDKAARLAVDRGVGLATVVADLGVYDIGIECWDVIVSIFAHMPPPVRRTLHANIVAALRPGGVLILEAYTPDQVGRGTGGPPIPELTMNLGALTEELAGLTFEHERETIRWVVEGSGHTGDGAVVQVIARKPA